MPLSNTRRAAASVFLLAVFVAGALLPVVAHGQGVNQIGTGNTSRGTTIGTGNPTTEADCGRESGQAIANPLKFCTLQGLLFAILDAAIQLGTVILTLALIYTGFLFVAARGKEESIKKARTALLFTIIGGLILLGSKTIALVIQDTVTSLTP